MWCTGAALWAGPARPPRPSPSKARLGAETGCEKAGGGPSTSTFTHGYEHGVYTKNFLKFFGADGSTTRCLPGTNHAPPHEMEGTEVPYREVVRHRVKEYVRDQAHTNGIESFWSLLKRGYVGTYL